MDKFFVRKWTRCFAPADRRVFSHLAVVLKAWTEPGRAYHNLAHLKAMLRVVQTTPQILGAFYHDAVYDPRAKDNEERSSDLALVSLTAMGCAPELITRVQDLILMTRGHVAHEGDLEGALFLDADLSILASKPKQYTQYAQSVRREYKFIPLEEFLTGRIKVLESFLARETLFWTKKYRDLETRARRNLTSEITSLKNQLSKLRISFTKS